MSDFKWKNQHTALTFVFLIWMVSYLDRMVMFTAIPYIAEEFQLSTGAMGAVMSAFFFGYAFCQIPGGILSDRYGARIVLTIGIVWWSIFTFVTGLASSLTALIVIRVLFGVGEGLAPPACFKTLATWTPSSKRGFANAVMLSTNSLGPALAPLMVVAIMSAFGWRSVFWILSLPGIVVVLWFWFALPENPKDKKGITQEELDELTTVPKGNEASDIPGRKLSFLEVIKLAPVWKSFLLLFFSNTALVGYMSWLPNYLKVNRGLDLTSMGIISSLPFFAGFIGALLSGYLMDRPLKNHRRALVGVLQVCMAGFLFLMYTSAELRMLVLFNTITGFFFGCCLSTTFNMPALLVPKEIIGQTMGIVNTSAQLAAFSAPIIMGLLITTNSDGKQIYDVAFGYICLCNLAAAVVVTMFFKPAEKTQAAQS
jgi:sugar phosphate permease